MKPVRFMWRAADQVMVPLRTHLDRCKQFVDGKVYELAQKRSKEEHNQFFAVLSEAWAQLPEEFQKVYGSAEKLRADTLIDNEFSHTQYQGCASEQEARRWASWVRKREKYTRVTIFGPVLKLESPESMAIDESGKDGMPVKRFREAKRLCFEQWAHMIGISVDELVEQSTQKRHAA